jgi:RsiW-degrading membrane proteinase PrsW (M82 family)
MSQPPAQYPDRPQYPDPRSAPSPVTSGRTGPSAGPDPSLPRRYDTSARPVGVITRQRYAPAPIQRPTSAQPHSAWAAQTGRVAQVGVPASPVPASRIIGWVLASLLGMLLVAVLGVLLLLYMAGSGGSIASWLLQAVFASFSLVVIVGVIVIADRWDPQPIPFLLTAVLWGAAAAAGLALLLNTLFDIVVMALTDSQEAAEGIGAILGAPVIEETVKGLGLVVLFLVGRRSFNGPLDGLVYGALIGGGFAFTENILYYGEAWTGGYEMAGLGGGVGTLGFSVIIRGILGIFGHAVYTSLTGVVMGLVARRWGTVPGVLVFLIAPWPGMFLHFVWNGGTTVLGDMGTIVLGMPVGMWAMLLGEMLGSALWLGLIGFLVHDESRLTRLRLGEYAERGWLTHEELTMLATWKGRREGRRWARSIGAAPVMKRFIRDSAELASTRQRLLADGAHPKALGRERDLLGKLTGNRQELLAHAM